MGAVLGSCLGSCAATCGCAALSKVLSCGSKSQSRVPHIVLMFFSVILAIVLRYYGDGLAFSAYKFSFCDDGSCYGNQIVFRISFCLFLYFLLHCIVIYAGAHSFNGQLFGLKVLLFLAAIFGATYIPNSVFTVYADISRFFSGLFLLFQTLIFIEFAYKWNQTWVSYDQTKWYAAILAFCAIFYILVIVMIAFEYVLYTKCDSNGLNLFFVTFTLILLLLFTGLSVSPYCEHGALLTSAVVSFYVTYLCWSALSSDPSDCNSFLQNGSGRDHVVQYVVGMLIAAFSISYAGWNVASTRDIFGAKQQEDSPYVSSHALPTSDPSSKAAPSSRSSDGSASPDKGRKKRAAGARNDENRHEQESDDEGASASGEHQGYFHLVMSIAAMYMSMLLTNWGETTNSNHPVDVGKQSMWVKMVSQWVTIALYLWSLAAPVIFPDRDFGH